jgi:hypothetical protein
MLTVMWVAVVLLLWSLLLLQGHHATVHGNDETSMCRKNALADNDHDDDDAEMKAVCQSHNEHPNMFLLPAAADDDDETATPASNDDPDASNEFFGAFRRLGTSWKNVAIVFRNVVSAAGGTQKRGDVLADTPEDALRLLADMVSMVAAAAASADDKEEEEKKGNDDNPWLFRNAPHQEFGLEITDIFKAFLTWAAVDGVEQQEEEEVNGNNNNNNNGGVTKKCQRRRGGVNGRHAKINVSKAFRRLERYAVWMDATGDDLVQPPLKASSLTKAWEAFSMTLSHDDCGRLVWWLDLGKTDLDAVRALPPKEILRLFVWFSHLMLFDEGGQENGIVFVQCFARMTFWSWMTMLPLNLGIQVDEFVISVIPLKTRIVLFLERPPWVRFGYRLLSAILTRAMKRRVFMVPDKNPQQSVEKVVNSECIPMNFDGLNGTLVLDPLFDILSRIPSSSSSSSDKPAPSK